MDLAWNGFHVLFWAENLNVAYEGRIAVRAREAILFGPYVSQSYIYKNIICGAVRVFLWEWFHQIGTQKWYLMYSRSSRSEKRRITYSLEFYRLYNVRSIEKLTRRLRPTSNRKIILNILITKNMYS